MTVDSIVQYSHACNALGTRNVPSLSPISQRGLWVGGLRLKLSAIDADRIDVDRPKGVGEAARAVVSSLTSL